MGVEAMSCTQCNKTRMRIDRCECGTAAMPLDADMLDNMTAPRVNPGEIRVWAALKDAGWKPIKNGWPDFLAVKPETGEVIAIEVKSRGGVASPEQLLVASIFENMGIETHFIWSDGDKYEARAGLVDAAARRRARSWYSILTQRFRKVAPSPTP